MNEGADAGMAEIEAKLLVHDAGHIEAVIAALESAGYSLGPGTTRTHLDSYHDTRGWDIYRAGYAYRCRQRGDSTRLTLKSLGGAEGDHYERDEIEQTLTEAPDRSLPDGPVARKLDAFTAGERRRKLFSVRTRRTTHALRAPGDPGTEMQMDIDETAIRAHRPLQNAPGRLAFTELELELLHGNRDTLDATARFLADACKLVPAKMSKFERGILAGGFSLPDENAASPEPRLHRDDPVIELLFRYLGDQFRIVRAQQAVAWEGLDPEGVHRMRVAIRRIRALLRESRDLLAGEPASELETDLRWLSRHLGEARDADICMAEIGIFDSLLADAGSAAVGVYEQHLEAGRLRAYAGLADAFADRRCATLMHRLDDLIATGPSAQTLDAYGELDIETAAATRVPPLARKVIARGDALGSDAPAAELHRLRIMAKRLRYLIEFYAQVQTRRWRKPIAALQKLHDVLGTHQDAVTSRARLEAFAATPEVHDPDVRAGFDRLIGYEEQRIIDCRQQFTEVWPEFRNAFA